MYTHWVYLCGWRVFELTRQWYKAEEREEGRNKTQKYGTIHAMKLLLLLQSYSFLEMKTDIDGFNPLTTNDAYMCHECALFFHKPIRIYMSGLIRTRR